MTTPDPTAVLRDVEWIAEHGACPICRACRRCSEMDRGVFKGHKADCALAAALATDPTAQIARLRAEVEQAREALAALEARITEALPYAYDDGEHPPDEATPDECVGYAATELTRLRAEVDRLTRERDDDMAENAQLRAAIVAWNDYNEATSGHTIAQRAYDESESDERRSFWTDAILTQSAKWAAAMKRLDAMGAWRGSPTWKYI